MVDGFLRLDEKDGLIHRYRHVYSDCYEDMGPHESNGNCLAFNDVTGRVEEVRPNRWNNSWERVGDFEPDGKTVGVRKDTGLVEETELNFFRQVVKKGGYVPKEC